MLKLPIERYSNTDSLIRPAKLAYFLTDKCPTLVTTKLSCGPNGSQKNGQHAYFPILTNGVVERQIGHDGGHVINKLAFYSNYQN